MKISLLILVLILNGCGTVRYTRTEINGEKVDIRIPNFGSKRSVKELEYKTPDGRWFLLRGYADNQTEIMQSAIEAALKAYQSSGPPVKP